MTSPRRLVIGSGNSMSALRRKSKGVRVHRRDTDPPASPGRELWRAGSAEERSHEALWTRRGLWQKKRFDPEKCQK
jgi:hypothetical protein